MLTKLPYLLNLSNFEGREETQKLIIHLFLLTKMSSNGVFATNLGLHKEW